MRKNEKVAITYDKTSTIVADMVPNVDAHNTIY